MSKNPNLRASRYYQNWLQLTICGSAIFLFLSGFFLSKEELLPSFFFLLFNLIVGYTGSELKYRRYKSIVDEAKRKELKNLRHSRFYQKWLQILGRGKEAFVFFLGLILGKGYFYFSIILLAFQLVNWFLTSEMVYRREQAVLFEKEIS